MLAVVTYTVTGAWSKVPATCGRVSVTVTWIVALPAVPDATVPTEEIFPGVLALSGSVTVTASPTATSRLLGGAQRNRHHVLVRGRREHRPEPRGAQAAKHIR